MIEHNDVDRLGPEGPSSRGPSAVASSGSARRRLQTKNVFVDVNIHVASKFVYHRGNLARLANLGDVSLVNVFDTEVDRREVDAHLVAHAGEAANLLKKFSREHDALSASTEASVAPLFRGPDADGLTDLYREEYGRFRTRARARDLPLPESAVAAVFSRYFDRRPPFTDKKKAEFPDAFIVATLSDWCRRESERMYVISSDAGFREAAQEMGGGRLIPVERLEEFLDRVVSAEHEGAAAEVQRWLNRHVSDLSKAITDTFIDRTGFYVEEAEGDAFDIEVENIRLYSPLLVEMSDEEATFDVSFEITFLADIQFEVPGTGFYDKEDDTIYFADRSHIRVRRTDILTAECRIEAYESEGDESEPRIFEIASVVIERDRDLRVSIEDEIVEVFADDEEDWDAYDEPDAPADDDDRDGDGEDVDF